MPCDDMAVFPFRDCTGTSSSCPADFFLPIQKSPQKLFQMPKIFHKFRLVTLQKLSLFPKNQERFPLDFSFSITVI